MPHLESNPLDFPRKLFADLIEIACLNPILFFLLAFSDEDEEKSRILRD